MITHFFPSPDDAEYLQYGVLDHVLGNVSFLAATPNTEMQFSSIRFKWHAHSQHLAVENVLPPSYYEDYVMTASYSEKMQMLQQLQLGKLHSLHRGKVGAQSFVEIGCGDGSFMKYARKEISLCLGIEPSRKFAEEAAREGLDVLIGYVGSENQLTSEKFDIFASRQVFEHLIDPLNVLIGIRKMLNPGAVGLIEVPNGQRAIRMKRFFEFSPDHVNYYSVNSLVALASDAGLNVLGCSEAFDGDYLELWVRNEPAVEKLFSEMRAQRDMVCAALTSKISEITAQGKRVVIWGCGAKTLSILAACPKEILAQIDGIIDSDPHKHGRYAPNTHIQVVSSDQGSALNPDAVFVLALSYREEIAAAVRERMPSCQSILTLDDHGWIMNL